ncbi:MAG: hypothetical protein N2C12_02770, partial [Planctomycetales bacterium]
VVERGNLIVFDPLKDPSGVFPIRDIHLRVDLDKTKSAKFRGSLTADHLSRAEMEGVFKFDLSQWQISGRVDGIALGTELQQALPGDISGQLTAIAPLQGDFSLDFRANYDRQRQRPLEFEAVGKLAHGRLDTEDLPYALTDLKGTVRVDPQGIVIEKMSARTGKTLLQIEGGQQGFGPEATIALTGQAQNFILDERMVAGLPPTWKQTWDRYQPAGEVNAAFQLKYNGQRWQPEFSVDCISVSFTHHKFPYRLKQTTGTVTLKNKHLSARLTAFAGSRPVEISAEITNPGPAGIGHLVARSAELPLDEPFLQAIPERIQKVVRSFHPRGTINGYIRVARDDPEQPWLPHTIVDLNGIAIQYEKFPYP